MGRPGWVASLIVVLLAGCLRGPMDSEADQVARGFFSAVRAGDPAKVDAALAPEAVVARDRHARFESARRAIPGGAAQEARAIGWSRTETGGRKRLTTLHLYRYPGADLVVSTVLERSAPTNRYKVSGLRLTRLAPGMIETNRFTLAGKGARQLGFLASAAASPLVMIGVALMVIFTPGLSWKPLWFALCFVGVGAATMNWTTGEGGFVLSQIGLINLGLARATDVSPWMIRFSAPLGALVVLVRLAFLKGREQG